MPRPYPLDLRERLLAARAEGLPVAEIEDKFHISRRSLNRWAERERTGVGLAPTPKPGRRRLIAPDEQAELMAMVAELNDATVETYCARWAATHGTRVSRVTMGRRLRECGLTRKKRPPSPANRTRTSAGSGGNR